MLHVAYLTGSGYGSVGRVVDFAEGWIDIEDPVFGQRYIAPEETFHLIETPGGLVLPFHHLDVEAGELVANPMEMDEAESGYAVAWPYIRRWREEIAPDWRTIALVGMFALMTIRTATADAEEAYRSVGPVLRTLLRANVIPTEEDIDRMLRMLARQPGFEATKARVFSQMIAFAPALRRRMLRSTDFTREFRNDVALNTNLPEGLSLAKLSFTVSLLGRDAACIDTEIMRSKYFFGSDVNVEKVFEQFRKRKGVISERALARYMALEDRLKQTPFWSPRWPMPFARAQWTLWESLIAERTEHAVLFEVTTREGLPKRYPRQPR